VRNDWYFFEGLADFGLCVGAGKSRYAWLSRWKQCEFGTIIQLQLREWLPFDRGFAKNGQDRICDERPESANVLAAGMVACCDECVGIAWRMVP